MRAGKSGKQRGYFSKSCKRLLLAVFFMAIGFALSSILAKVMAGRSLTSALGSMAPSVVVLEDKQASLSAALATPAPAAPGQARDVTEAVRQALSGVPLRVSTDQQQEEWDQALVSFMMGAGSCAEVCGERECARDWIAHVDACAVVDKVLPGGTCEKSMRADLPQHSGAVAGGWLVSADSKGNPPTCNVGPGPGGAERLCPCVPKARKEGGKGIVAVKNVLIKILKAKVGEAPGVGFDRLQDVEANRVSFFRGTNGEACETVCKNQELRCSASWFEHVNHCEALLAAFPTGKGGEYLSSCDSNFYGGDLPGYQTDKNLLLLNNDPAGFATTCAATAKRTSRLCPCVYRYPNQKVTYHTVYSVQSKQYFEWQSRYLHFWHKQVGQPGKITRLLAMGGAWPRDPKPHPFGDHLMRQLPTHIHPEYDPRIDTYTAYNKPLGIAHWLQTTKVEEDVIIILDPDCAIIEKAEFPVEEGAPIAQPGYYKFNDPKSYEVQILNHYCKGVCTHYDPIAVPVIIHRNDLDRLAPLWLRYTEDIRRDRQGPNKWPIEWNDNKFVVNRIEWVAEMFGYVLAAAHLDLRHEIRDLQMVPSVHRKILPKAPVLHFHVPVETSDKKRWSKGDEDAGNKLIWPVAPGTDAVITRLLTALHDAHEAVGVTQLSKDHKWRGYWNMFYNEAHDSEDPLPSSVIVGPSSSA